MRTPPSYSMRKISAPAHPGKVPTFRLASTPSSRSSSKSSGLSSGPSSTLVGQTLDTNTEDHVYRDSHQARLSHVIKSSSYSMRRRSSRTQDELDSASRRSSGRTRKLTEKYQALTGSKLLPTGSSNIAAEDQASPTTIANPEELLQVIKPRRRSSTAIARSDSPQAVACLLPADVVSAKINEEAKDVLTASDVVEESPKRASRRERKPTAKYLESIAAPEASDDLEEQSKPYITTPTKIISKSSRYRSSFVSA